MPKLEVRNLAMQFPAVRALDGVSLAFQAGEVHGVIGENGAGKSTLMKILSGLQQPTEGTIWLEDSQTHLSGVRDALQKGIAMIHQELNLVDELTVAENVFLGREKTKGGMLDSAAMNAETASFLAEVRAPFEPTTPVGDLSVAGKQLVEIAKALAANASVLIMDEPTAVLSDPESEALFELILKLKGAGVTILYISHRLVEVSRICDRISVLRDGKWVTTLPAAGSTPSDLASLMVGRPLSEFFPPKVDVPVGAPILEVIHARVPGYVRDASFSVRAGEILGLAGLVGAGRTELAEGIIGVRQFQGELKLDGKAVTLRNPHDALRNGIAYVSEDRKALGLILSMSIIENTTLANLSAYASPLVKASAELACAEKWKQEFDLRANDLYAPVGSLSGGNQQKVSLAKWLDTNPRVLILDEPTRGVDVGAKREIYSLIQRFAATGLACVVISSEMSEIIGMCHRTVVMREGQSMGELTGSEMTEESIMALAAGVAA